MHGGVDMSTFVHPKQHNKAMESKMTDTNQSEASEQLAQELQTNGHDITYLDLLDALASTGLCLALDKDNAASADYMENLQS